MSQKNESNNSELRYLVCLGIWLGYAAQAWLPLILVTLFAANIWRIVLTVIAAIWLLAIYSTVRKNPATRPLNVHLVAGGVAIVLSGIFGPKNIFTTIMYVLIVVVFINAPFFMKFAGTEREKKSASKIVTRDV